MVRTPWLLATLLFASLMILVMMGPFEVLVPFLIKDRLGGGPGDHALVLAAFGIGGAVGSLAMASLQMPRRYLTLMNLMWGVGCLPLAGRSASPPRSGSSWSRRSCSGALFSAPMVIWGTLLQRRVPAAHARPGRLARLLRLDQPDAGVDGAGRPGLRGDRPAHDVRDRRHRARVSSRSWRCCGPAAAGRARPPAARRRRARAAEPSEPARAVVVPCTPGLDSPRGSLPSIAASTSALCRWPTVS